VRARKPGTVGASAIRADDFRKSRRESMEVPLCLGLLLPLAALHLLAGGAKPQAVEGAGVYASCASGRARIRATARRSVSGFAVSLPSAPASRSRHAGVGATPSNSFV